jgi:hypothetical protein
MIKMIQSKGCSFVGCREHNANWPLLGYGGTSGRPKDSGSV